MRIQRAPSEAAFYFSKWLLEAVTVVFMVAPAILIVVLSFSAHDSLLFPPQDWGLRQYSALLGSSYYLQSIGTSFLIAIPTAVISIAIGVPAAIALERSRMRGKTILRVLGVAPIVLPGAAYAVALYLFYAETHILGSFWGVVLAEVTLAVPFVIMIVGVGLRRIPADLELVAMSLGASRTRATFGITLRLLLPSIAASAVLAFVTVFDEVVLVNFLGAGQIITLPKAIYDSFRTGTEPLITAVATLLMLLTGLLMLLATRWRKVNTE
jgi:ABC-type spermidine/putrescine transport system permease subunit II